MIFRSKETLGLGASILRCRFGEPPALESQTSDSRTQGIWQFTPAAKEIDPFIPWQSSEFVPFVFFFFIFWEGGVMAPLLRLLQEAAQGNVCFCRAVKVDRALVEERRAGFPTHWGEKPFYRKTMFHGQIKKIRISCFISVIPPATPFLFRLYSKSISLPIYLSIYVSIYIYFASS